MLLKIYALPLYFIVIIMLLIAAGWTCFCKKLKKKCCTVVCGTASCFAIFTILYATILSRGVGEREAVLVPFAALAAAREEPELYREMLMNVFLFFPLGLTLVHALPPKWRRWQRIACTTLIGCLLSAAIEYTQYCFALGMAETDDVICNTLGTLLGAASLLLAHLMETHKKGPRT